MIIQEQFTVNGQVFTLTYSNLNKMIRNAETQQVYSKAYDIAQFEYEETDTAIVRDRPPTTGEQIAELQAQNAVLTDTLDTLFIEILPMFMGI